MKNEIVINANYIKDYKNIIQKTNLQRDYQELMKFLKYLKNCLQKEMIDFNFTANVVENNMDYSYFQFTNDRLKNNGLKIVFTFIHKEFKYQIWLSGVNRQEQVKFLNVYKKDIKYSITQNPLKTDYIICKDIETEFEYNDLNKLISNLKSEIYMFVKDIFNIIK